MPNSLKKQNWRTFGRIERHTLQRERAAWSQRSIFHSFMLVPSNHVTMPNLSVGRTTWNFRLSQNWENSFEREKMIRCRTVADLERARRICEFYRWLFDNLIAKHPKWFMGLSIFSNMASSWFGHPAKVNDLCSSINFQRQIWFPRKWRWKHACCQFSTINFDDPDMRGNSYFETGSLIKPENNREKIRAR